MKLRGILFCHFLLGRLTCAFLNLHLNTKTNNNFSPHTRRSLKEPTHRRSEIWESSAHVLVKASPSTARDMNLQKRNGSVQIFKRFFFKFLSVLVKNPFKLFSWVISINELKSLVEIASTLHSREEDKRRSIKDKLMITRVVKEKECERAAIEVLSTAQKPTVSERMDDKSNTPYGGRWAVAARGVDFSGKWQLCFDDEFKEDYDRYLMELGQPLIVRAVAKNLLPRTKEDLMMSNEGRSLVIRGENARGIWERELITSGTEVGKPEFEPRHYPIMTADSEEVEAENWWECNGTVHVSIVHGVSRYFGGGTFESRRYLEDGGNTYVCNSTFHFKDVTRKPNSIEWRFRRIQD